MHCRELCPARQGSKFPGTKHFHPLTPERFPGLAGQGWNRTQGTEEGQNIWAPVPVLGPTLPSQRLLSFLTAGPGVLGGT
jgi:hypothetical protein